MFRFVPGGHLRFLELVALNQFRLNGGFPLTADIPISSTASARDVPLWSTLFHTSLLS